MLYFTLSFSHLFVLLSAILFKEEDYNKRSQRNNNKMIASLIGTKDPTIQCDILFYPQYQNDHGQVVCYPGSVFEGVVKIKLQNSMPIHHIKLVFKAAGNIYYFIVSLSDFTFLCRESKLRRYGLGKINKDKRSFICCAYHPLGITFKCKCTSRRLSNFGSW